MLSPLPFSSISWFTPSFGFLPPALLVLFVHVFDVVVVQNIHPDLWTTHDGVAVRLFGAAAVRDVVEAKGMAHLVLVQPVGGGAVLRVVPVPIDAGVGG